MGNSTQSEPTLGTPEVVEAILEGEYQVRPSASTWTEAQRALAVLLVIAVALILAALAVNADTTDARPCPAFSDCCDGNSDANRQGLFDAEEQFAGRPGC